LLLFGCETKVGVSENMVLRKIIQGRWA